VLVKSGYPQFGHILSKMFASPVLRPKFFTIAKVLACAGHLVINLPGAPAASSVANAPVTVRLFG
jgi:hypothetical protein